MADRIMLITELGAMARDAALSGDDRLATLMRDAIELLIEGRPAQADGTEIRGFGRPKGDGYVYYMRAGADIKIGRSRNPWARLREIQRSRPDAVLVAFEPGDFGLERERHKQFESLRVAGEWFASAPDLEAHIVALVAATRSYEVTTALRVATPPYPPSPSSSFPTPHITPSPTPTPHDTPTPRAREAAGPSVVRDVDAEYAAQVEQVTAEVTRQCPAECWPALDAFLRRRQYVTWHGWLKAFLQGAISTTWPDVAAVCTDDSALDRPIGTPKGFRVFLASAKRDRVAPAEPTASPTPRGNKLEIGRANIESAINRRERERAAAGGNHGE